MAAPKNLRELATKVTKLEGKKKSISVAQVSEVLKILRGLLKKHPVEVLRLLIR